MFQLCMLSKLSQQNITTLDFELCASRRLKRFVWFLLNPVFTIQSKAKLLWDVAGMIKIKYG